jgi:hypothetical protein
LKNKIERKNLFNETVKNSKETFNEDKVKYALIREKQRGGNLAIEDMSFLKNWPKVKKDRLTQLHEQAEIYMVMYEEYCLVYNLPCKWSSAKTVDDSRKMLNEFVESKGCTDANVLLMIGIGNNGQNNTSVTALVAYFMNLLLKKSTLQYDGDNFSGDKFDENAIVRNIADVARYMCTCLGLDSYMYMRFAASAFDTSMSFDVFCRKHGEAHHIELCPGSLDDDGNVVYGGGNTHIFEAKYQQGSLATVVVCGAGDIGVEEIRRAVELGYKLVVVSTEQLRNGAVVTRDVYKAAGIQNYTDGQVSVVHPCDVNTTT